MVRETAGNSDVHQTYSCPSCGAQNALGQPFCGTCGARLTPACPRCGATVDPSSRFCTNCGGEIYPTIPVRSHADRTGTRESKWGFPKPSGRFSRPQFAFFCFIPILVTVVLAGMLNYGQSFFFVAIAGLITWVPLQIYLVIVAGIRRLHDLNHSGWYVLLAFIPLGNVVMLLYLLFAPGRIEGNRWLK